MQSIICPLDGTPCDPECPDRFHDTEGEGGKDRGKAEIRQTESGYV